ncbi:hypothetical protein RJ639_003961 [Escallonia herrerae]|uniref:Uncharacterized protein n=1 Tax=Escallonia herrerae TaxID=1293975 RepID=A0AA88VZI5_9ASTE|nr:hypothetical protein RJ639_003961 [Escallonia herrerae]
MRQLSPDMQQQLLRLPADLIGKLITRVAARTVRRDKLAEKAILHYYYLLLLGFNSRKECCTFIQLIQPPDSRSGSKIYQLVLQVEI